MQIIPTVHEKSWPAALARIENLAEFTKWMQVDVEDGIFTPDKTFELESLRMWEKTEKYLWEMHLMVKEPISWLNKCVHSGAGRVVGQVEKMQDRGAFVKAGMEMGLEIGLGIDADSEIGEIPEGVEEILLLGRKAGFGVLPFEKKTYEKVEQLVKLREERNALFKIGVDGGVDKEILEKLRIMGVDIVYSGENYLELK